ncbi:MAG: TonB-dependent receptor [Pontixanthobacter sp.]
MLKNTLFLASGAPFALGIALCAAPAAAQIQPSEQNVNENDATPLADDIQTVVVTGSRFTNPNLEQSSPVAVVTDEEINLRQPTVVEDLLREIPGVTPSIGAQVNNGNGGATFVDLRGIGNNRNLTLLNGTRVVPADLQGRTNVDVIPVALLERVDVLTGGASTTYGADAISGVVNFITKRDFEGAEITALQGITEEGDGSTQRIDLTVGGNFADGRGNAVLSIGYTDRDVVTQGAREFSEFNLSSFSGNPGGSSTAVPTVITVPGTTSGTLQVSPDGNSLVPFDRPFNFNPFNIFQLPLEQYRIFGAGHYEIADGIEAFGEALFVQSTNSTIIAPSGTFRNVLTTPLSNPFLNAGIRNQICGLDTVADDPENPASIGVQRRFSQAECDAAAVATDPDDDDFRTVDLDFGRRFVELGNRTNEYETQLFQFKAGLRGDITSTLQFEVFGAYGESENDSFQSGNGTFTRLQQSLLATSADECLDTSNNCVPINLFGPLGSITQDVADFLDVGNRGGTETSLTQVQGFVSGDFGFAFPGAITPLSIVLGGEYREYEASTSSDLLTQTPGEILGNGAASPDSFGTYDVKEVFGELAIPLIEDSFIPELTILLGGRISDYSTTGTEYTYKAGATAEIFPGFQLRGNYQRATRAPNIFELFQPQVTGLDNFDSDPCAGATPVGNAQLTAICLAQGAPANVIGNIQVDPAGQVNNTFGGNRDLEAEKADTFTIGAIFQPDFIRGLSITVDYFNIDLSDAITTPTIDSVLANCFGDFREAPGGSATDPACTDFIRRNPATGNLFGSVATTPGIVTVFSNLGSIETDGIDLVFNYQRDLGLANLNFNFAGTWTNSNFFNPNQNDPDGGFECAGFFGTNCGSIIPEFSFNQRTTLGFDGVDLSLLWRYIDGVELEASNFNAAGSAPFLDEFESISAEHYFDLSARFDVTPTFQLTATALNLFDNKPPIVGSNIGSTAFNSGNTFPSTYDPLGRRYSVTASLTF